MVDRKPGSYVKTKNGKLNLNQNDEAMKKRAEKEKSKKEVNKDVHNK